MDARDLFRRLCVGAKFDLRRFSADAARFQVLYRFQAKARVTEKGREPEKLLAAGGARTQRPRGLVVGHFPLFGVQVTAAF